MEKREHIPSQHSELSSDDHLLKLKSPHRRERQPDPGFNFLPNEEASEIKHTLSAGFRLDEYFVLYAPRSRFPSYGKEVLHGIVEEIDDSGERVPLMAEVVIKQESFMLRSLKTALGFDSCAQYKVSLSPPKNKATVQRLVSLYKQAKYEEFREYIPDEQERKARTDDLNHHCDESLRAWGIS